MGNFSKALVGSYKIIFIFYTLFLNVPFLNAETLNNAGFVNGIWYSQNPFFSGDTIRIYTAIQNQSGTDITGTANFMNGGVSIGTASFSVVNGRLSEVWTDWKVAYGYHDISVKLENVKMVEVGKKPKDIALNTSVLDGQKVFADEDTDGDRIGNEIDDDDDNDGLSDAEELKIGSDPLKKDTDDDGISDGEDKEPTILNSKEELAKNSETKNTEDKKEEAKTPSFIPAIITENIPVEKITALIPAPVIEKTQEINKAFSGFIGKQKNFIDATRETIENSLTKRKRADIDGNGKIDIFDFNLLMVNWGVNIQNKNADIDENNKVDIFDFNLLIVEWSL